VTLFTVHSIEENAQAQADYMPGGKLWRGKNILDSKIRELLRGFGTGAKRQEEALDAFWEEIFIGTTEEYIGDFERAVGIPDDCFDGGGTLEERRLNVIVKLTSIGITTREDFEELAAVLGFDDVNVLPGLAGGDDVILNGNFVGDFDWDTGLGWDISGGSANKTPGAVSSLSQDVTILTDEYVFLRYEIKNITAGTITPKIGSISGTPQSTNGLFEEFINVETSGIKTFPLAFPHFFGRFSFSTTFEFESDAAFDGSIDNVSLNESILPIQTGRFTLVVEFPAEGNIQFFPLSFPHIFGNSVFEILACLYEKLKPSNCELLLKNVFDPVIDSYLFGWGDNASGQLGIDSLDPSTIPLEVLPSLNWASASASALTTYAIKNNRTIWAWGDNTFGQLGNNTFDDEQIPIQMGNFLDWVFIGAGASHMLSIKEDGTLWGVGRNTEGELGFPSNDSLNRSFQEQVGTDTDWVAAAGGAEFSFALKADGTLYSTGSNGSGQLGQGNTTPLVTFTQETTTATDWAFVATGLDFTIAIKTDGTLYACGNNSDGQLGDGTTGGTVLTLIQETLGNSTWVAASAGQDFMVALRTDGTLWSTGANVSGQLGQGNTTPLSTLTQIVGASNWVAVSCGEDHVLALNSDDELFSWGNNDDGQLGNGDTGTDVLSPVEISTSGVWRVIGAGTKYSMAIGDINIPAPLPLGELFSAGFNSLGQLGTGNQVASEVFIQESSSDVTWVSITSAENANLGIKEDGTLWGAGQNFNGNLGLGNNDVIQEDYIQEVLSDTDWIFVTAGSQHSIALKTDGTLWSTGLNSNGQLGQGDTDPLNTFTQIESDTDWAVVAASADSTHSLAIKTNGRLYAWGNNNHDQLGLGTGPTDEESPVVVGTDLWSSIGPSQFSSRGIQTDGTLWVWGQNNQLQLGLGATGGGDVTVPTQVGVDVDWVKVAGGTTNSIALKSDGTIWVCGDDSFGQLGLGAGTTDEDEFVQMGSDMDWSDISANENTVYALKTDGTLWGWGENDQGQLGLNDDVQRDIPTQVGSDTDHIAISMGASFGAILKLS